MSGSTTRRMLAAYIQMAAPTLFLSGFFRSPPANFHTTEEVEIDIVRSDEDIAIYRCSEAGLMHLPGAGHLLQAHSLWCG